MPGGYKDHGGGADNGEGCYKCGKHGHFARECEDWRHGRRDQEDITKEFKTWNYGSTQGGQGSHGGYTDYQDPAGHGEGFGGKGGGKRDSLPPQEESIPLEVATKIAKDEKLIDSLPGVMVKADDGSVVKVVDPKAPLPLPDVKPDPSRFDKSLSSILNGRNAAMFVNMESKKRGWDIEFEMVDSEGPVHDRTYSYTLTVGPKGSDDVIVTAGIAKNKKDAKKRCSDAMVLKIADLPAVPNPPPGFMGPPGFRGRGGWRGRGGRWMRGQWRGGFGFGHPGMPTVESEETIFKKYDKSPSSDHPSQHHPISKLCERSKKRGWPGPVWELVNEKVIDSKSHRYGRHNTMLYTMKVTVWPGKGQVDPRVYFGSGPTKKDAKFACGAVAWADLEDDNLTPQGASLITADPTLEAPMEPLDAAAVNKLNPEQLKQYLAQQAIRVQSETFKGFKRPDVDPDKWRELVAKDAQREREHRERDRQREARVKKNKEGYVEKEGGLLALVEKEEETMGSCSNRYSDEMMMLKASVEKDRHERSRHRSSSTVSSRSGSTRRSRSRSRSRRRSRSRESSSRREGSKRRSRSRGEREKSRHRSSSTFSSRSSSSTGHDDRDKRDY